MATTLHGIGVALRRGASRASASLQRSATGRGTRGGRRTRVAGEDSGEPVSEPGSIRLAFLNGYHPSWSKALAREVAGRLPYEVELLDLDLDLEAAFDSRRGQHQATLMIAHLLRHLPDPADKIIGITSLDLFAPVLTFVFGQSQLDGAGAVVSTHRLRNEYYGLPGDEALAFERTLKEVLHELGHALGLVHCPDHRCVMSPSTHVGEVDLKRAWYCPQCETVLTAGHWH